MPSTCPLHGYEVRGEGKGLIQEPAAMLDTSKNGSYKELLGGKKAQAWGVCARMEEGLRAAAGSWGVAGSHSAAVRSKLPLTDM